VRTIPWVLFCSLVSASAAWGADRDAIFDKLISVKLDGGAEQAGVLTTLKGDQPHSLALTMPGDPGVVRAEVADGRIANSRMRGHPFVRARHLLVRPGLAALLVDCRSDSGDSCRESYVLSRARFDDVMKLLARVKQDVPTVKKVWVVGHSYGGHSSAAFARYGEGVIDGAILASAVLGRNNVYPMLVGWDFSAAKVPQLIVSQRNDPCKSTSYSAAEYTARRYNIPIAVVTQASGAKGDPCGPFSEHGFVGAERVFMDIIADAVENGVAQFRK
jgi:pimeloyl-ACP methyl ester carboxylesterase